MPEPWGIRAGKVGFDFKKVMARKNALIKDFADYRRQQLAAGKFKFVRAQARFLDPHTVKLSNGKTLTAAHFIIATGSTVAPPPLPQLCETGYLTSDDALRLKRLPKSLIVLGGGAIACEFAQFFARFGVKVTLIQRSEHILREFDTDAAMEIEKVFQREGIGIFTNTKLTDAKRDGRLKTVSFRHKGKTAFGFRRGNLIRVGPHTEHGVAQPGWRRGRQRAWPHRGQQVHANERAAHLRGGRLHRAA